MALTQVQGGMIVPSTTLTTPIVATTMGVGGATPAGSGSGITFPATQSASSDANTLDDYEEGTWTPSYVGTSTNPTVTYGGLRAGWYTKIGNQVTAWCQLSVVGTTGGSGQLRLGGLPFTSNSNSSFYSSGSVGTVYNLGHSASYCQFGIRIPPNSTTAELFEFGTQGGRTIDTGLPISALFNGEGYGSYMVTYIV
jgi:hypothetical protein